LCLLGDTSLESLALNPLFKERNLILVVGLDRVDH